jgi:hypothetical protein
MGANYSQAAKYYANNRTKKLRELLIRDFGGRNYRLTRHGDVHVFGKMPNSVETGWYLLGTRAHVESEYQL